MCDCVKDINEKLKEKNLRLSEDFVIDIQNAKINTALFLTTEFIDSSKKKRGEHPKHFFLSYCPFCGKKYPQPKKSKKETKKHD
ncbi:MAG: hypothetical protein M0R06_08320 [Sphaerochaeta sp.]|jgi:hypothetical protein|nr:hypothetical protein [Sphaerochaeta sp.]